MITPYNALSDIGISNIKLSKFLFSTYSKIFEGLIILNKYIGKALNEIVSKKINGKEDNISKANLIF